MPSGLCWTGKRFRSDVSLSFLKSRHGLQVRAIGVARFFNIDRFAEKYNDVNPYHYTKNNPIYYMEVMGDSLKVNDNAAKTAVSRVKSIVDTALKGQYEFDSYNGYVGLKTTGTGPMTKEQTRFFNVINDAIKSTNVISFDAVDSSDAISQNITVGDNGASDQTPNPGRHVIDTEDMEKFGTGGLLTSEGALGHEFKEGFEIQQNGKSPAASHRIGIFIENEINGTQSGGATYPPDNPNVTIVPVTYNGVTKNVTINAVNQQITTLQNNIK